MHVWWLLVLDYYARLNELTTLSVPTNSFGGSTPVVTIIWTKLDVIPMTMIMEMAWRTRTPKNILLKGMAP
jgi:hypothetical protein